MTATTYGRYQQTPRQTGGARGIGNAVLNWLCRIGENSGAGRAAAVYQRLNAMSDDELARLGLRREDLVTRCFAWRGLY